MRIKEIFKITRGTRVIMLITFTVSLLAVGFAFIYYNNINSSHDPRIAEARRLLTLYDKESSGLNSSDAFSILDSADAVFSSLQDYSRSFEKGLIYNNKCTYLLMAAMYDTSVPAEEKKIMLDLAGEYCDTGMMIYRRWLSEWGNLSEEQIREKIKPGMQEDDPAFNGHNYQKIFNRRIRYITEAQVETPRRLSVSLTNKGTIYRHQIMPDSAAACLQQALKLWPDNRTAASNISVLYGGETIKPSVIQTLFPPERIKVTD
jgi:tetratricopeptide (TPR) repeat protein